ncbi:MAG: DUF4340 domain-containing protein [Myxococcota bacterium]
MDDRQMRLLVVLSGATIAAALIYLLLPGAQDDPPWDRRATEPVWSLDANQVVALTVKQSNKDTLTIQKQGEDWVMVSPVKEPADPLRVEAVLKRLAKVDRGVPIDGEQLASLGLANPPAGQVEVTLASGASLSLDLGQPAPVGWQTYARAPSGAIVAVAGHFEKDVLLDPWTFRDASVFDFDPKEFSGMQMQSPGGLMTVRRDSGDLFWLVGTPAIEGAAPIDFGRGDGPAIENLVLTLLDLRLDAFMDNAAPGGIDAPQHRVAVELRDGTVHEARFGAELPMGRLVQAPDGSQGSILQERLAFLDMGPTDLADSKAFPTSSSRTRRIEVSIDGRQTELVTDGAGWSATGVEQAVGPRLYRAVQTAGIDRQVRFEGQDLGEVTGRVRAHMGADEVRLVELGRVVGRSRLARDVSGGPIYAVPEAEVQAIVSLLPE